MWPEGPGQARDESRRLIVRGSVEPGVWRWQYFARLLGLVILASSVSVGGQRLKGLRPLGLFRTLEGHAKAPEPRIVAGCAQQGLSYPIKAILANNLGGKGPEQGAEMMQYLVSLHEDGRDREDLKVSVRALSDYQPHSPQWNGMEGDFGSINQMPGANVRLRFEFSDMANAPLQLDGFRLLLCDLDGSRDGFEYVRAYGRHQAFWAKDTEMQLFSSPNAVEYNLREPYRVGSRRDLGPENPTYAAELTLKQEQSCVSLKYGSVDHVDLVVGSSMGGDGARSFFFAFTGLEHCGMQAASSSTTSGTTSSFTSTSRSATRTQSWSSTTSSYTGSSGTSTSLTTTTASTVTRSTTTELVGLPIFASPELAGRPVDRLIHLVAMVAYVGALLSMAVCLMLYGLCSRGAGSSRLLQL